MPSDAVTQYFAAKVLLVLPFDLGHGEQAIDELMPAASCGIFRRVFVLHNVIAFEFTGSVHGQQPSRDMTQRLKRSANDNSSNLSPRVRRRAKSRQHFSDEPPMMPFLIFNGLDALPLLGIRNRMPMPSIGIRRGPFAGIRKAKDFDQLRVKGVLHRENPMSF